MKKYSYYLFPKALLIVGYILILLSIASTLEIVFSIKSVDHFNYSAPIGFMVIGLIIVSFRSTFIIDKNLNFILKESNLFGMILSREKIKIPHNCKGILIRRKIKKGTGYYRFILPVSYTFTSLDMFFYSESGLVRIINTDYSRALKIAGFLKSDLNLGYILE